MTPFVAKDGSKHTNRDTMVRADARHASKQPAPKAAMMGGEPTEDQDEMQEEPQDGASIAAEHGPATDVEVHHDHEGGKHTVHHSHSDGHQGEAEHGSADEAHRFVAAVSGVGGGGGMDDGGMGGGAY